MLDFPKPILNCKSFYHHDTKILEIKFRQIDWNMKKIDNTFFIDFLIRMTKKQINLHVE